MNKHNILKIDWWKFAVFIIGVVFVFFFSLSRAYAFTGSDGSVGDYCCRFQCCNGTWIAVNCQTYPGASCVGVNMDWWCYYNGGYGDCPADCVSGCNACALYSYLSTANYGYGSKSVSCVDDCGDTDWDTCYCTSPCTPASCPSGTSESGAYGFYQTYTCTNACGVSNSRSCYCTSPCSLASCPSQYSTTNQGYGSLTYDTCTNQCGQSRTRTCYCYACELATCASGGYSSTNLGYGSLTYDTCTNNCGQSRTRTCYCSQCNPGTCPSGTSDTGEGNLYTPKPSCTNDCGQTKTLNCYYDCEKASCSTLQSKVTWLDSCPDDKCRTTVKDITISDPAPGCPSEEIDKTCYYNNTRPQSPDKNTPENGLDVNTKLTTQANTNYIKQSPLLSKLVSKIRAQEQQDNVWGYTSDTHTGTQLNNPLQITSEYSDVDGQEDIVAVYLWFSSSETKDFITPNRIANPTEGLDGKTENNENFGFLVRRNDEGNWDKVYIPHIEGETKAWVEAGTISSEAITINGVNGDPMVNIQILDISNIDDQTIQLQTSMQFLYEEGGIELVVNTQYNIWTLANDVVGFLPFDEYDEIEDSEDEFWTDSGNDWNVDLANPVKLEEIEVSDLQDANLGLTFSIQDNESNLSRIRLDACGSWSSANDLISTFEGEDYNYPLVNCETVDWSTNIGSDINMVEGLNLIGNNPIDPQSGTYNVSEGLSIDLNGNGNGVITFYLTFIDEAGNIGQSLNIHRLGDWAAVKDGLVYGSQGVLSATRNLEGTLWDVDSVLRDSKYGFDESTIDLTNVALLGGYIPSFNSLGFLEKTSTNLSFKAYNLAGVYINTPYNDLMKAYEDKEEKGSIDVEHDIVPLDSISTIETNLLQYCGDDPQLCILKRTGDLEISRGFECDRRGLIAVTGDVTINPNFTNTDTSTSNACIIIAGGDIIITQGDDQNSTVVDYDILEAFLIASGDIVIESDTNQDGLLVKGGLTAFNPSPVGSAINNQRSISLEHIIYPVLAIESDGRYGLLSKLLFGSQTDIFQTDIGFKPY
jgi:hypothetical protein